MAIQREWLILAVLVLLIAALAMVIQFVRFSSFDSDASRFVMEDLRSKYPYADIEIMSMDKMMNAEGEEYLEVKARVTQMAGTPCPERMHLFYNYPSQNFVAQPPEVITSGCSVCQESPCVIAFPEEAVIGSHTLAGSDAVTDYISLHKDASASAVEHADSWRVSWDSPSSTYYLEASVDRSGAILSIDRVQKP